MRSLSCLIAALALAPALALAVPQQIAHQGQLFDGDGPVTDQVTITFDLFDDETGGDLVWTEDRTVDVVDGAYSVLLGTDVVGNPLEPVILGEPVLYLQLTIDGGDPLLPRQAVASVPFAVAAGTAENVVGGVVDASEILVDGAPVVDEDGDWVGGSGSVDWSSIGGVPGELSDGDADTLGGLSCADGGRAVWDDGSTSWVCGSDLVELDRIDTFGAVEGDVLTFEAGGVDWAPVSGGGGGCTITPLGLEVAELDCGGDVVRLETAPEYVDLMGPNVRLLADGTIRAFTTASPPAGTYVALEGSTDYVCALDAAGQATCWSTDLTTTVAGTPGGNFEKIDCAQDSACCGIYTTGALTCWSPDGSSLGVNPAPAGTFTDVSLANVNIACAVTDVGDIHCWGDSNATNLHSHRPTSSGWTHVRTTGGEACAASPTQTGLCWSTSYYPGGAPSPTSIPNHTIPPGDYTDIEIASYTVWGLLSSGGVNTSTGRLVPWDFVTFGGQLPGYGAFVGVTTDGTIRSYTSPSTAIAPP